MHRHRHIHGLCSQCRRLFGCLDLLFLGCECATEFGAQLAHELASILLLICGQGTDGLAGLRHCRIRSCIAGPNRFQRLHAGGLLDEFDAFAHCGAYRLGIEYRTLCHE